MARRRGIGVVAVCALLVWPAPAGAGVAGAAANEAPLADAGLDQTVALNATVQLDASGSRDPDGEITGYEWTVESPTGAEFEPECGSCAATEFRATTTGTYNATVTVTDDDGATRSDTLRVTVRVVEPPTVRLTGPGELVVGAAGRFDARATAGEVPLASLEWVVNGSRVASEALEGDSGNATLSRAFDSPGRKTLRARVVDRLGRARTTSRNVTVVSPADAFRSGGSGNDTSDCDRTDAPKADPCEDRAYFDVSDGSVVLHDGDNDGQYSFKGIEIESVDVEGQMTDTIRVDQSLVTKSITGAQYNFPGWDDGFDTNGSGGNSDTGGDPESGDESQAPGDAFRT